MFKIFTEYFSGSFVCDLGLVIVITDCFLSVELLEILASEGFGLESVQIKLPFLKK